MSRLGNYAHGRALRLAGLAFSIAIAAGCGSSPTTSTATTTTSSSTTTTVAVAEPPAITCPVGIPFTTISFTGARITYPLPPTEKGEEPLSVACTPPSGNTFPLGDTRVECTVTDALGRTASCSFILALTRVPSLTKTRFLAFGDSVTAGEVTFPVGTTTAGVITRQVLVPSAAYPTVLAKNLQAAYKLQEDVIAVANYGLGGERAAVARDRFIRALGTVNPDAVLIMEGYNDIPLGEDGAASAAAREIRIMAAEARGRGMRVFIATLAPSRPGSRSIRQVLLDDYNNRMRDAALREGAVLVDVYGALLSNVNLYIGLDGLHPTEIGYAKIADTFMAAIRSEFEAR